MEFNSEKCSSLHFDSTNNRCVYQIKSKEIKQNGQEKDLGVHITEDLKVRKQCSESAKKGNQISGMIRTII